MSDKHIGEIMKRNKEANADLIAEYECGSYISTRGYATIKESLSDIRFLLSKLSDQDKEIKRLRDSVAEWEQTAAQEQ